MDSFDFLRVMNAFQGSGYPSPTLRNHVQMVGDAVREWAAQYERLPLDSFIKEAHDALRARAEGMQVDYKRLSGPALSYLIHTGCAVGWTDSSFLRDEFNRRDSLLAKGLKDQNQADSLLRRMRRFY